MRRELLLLEELIEAAEQAQRLVEGMTTEQLSSDRVRRDALLWNFTVLGEAANQLPDEVKARFPEVPWQQPIRLRNRVYRLPVADDGVRRWVGSMPEAYEKWLVPTVFGPFAVDLAARVAARSPTRVLELAAGTGALTRELARVVGSAEITATDLNDAMVALGRTRAPGATWQQADATRLPFDDGTFDLVACQFGVMFLPDKPAAYREVRRVLTPDGTFLFNAWSTLAAHDFEAAFMAALERLFPNDPPTFLATTPHGYADPDRIAADVQAGGLRCTTVETVTLQGRAESVAGLATGYCTGTPVRAEIVDRGDLATTTAAVTRELEAQLGTGPITVRMTAHVVAATAAG